MLGVGVFLLLLTVLPIRIRFRAAATAQGGHGEIKIRVLCIPLSAFVRFRLTDGPLGGEIFPPFGRMRTINYARREDQEVPVWITAPVKEEWRQKIRAEWIIGVAGAPDLTALVTGFFATLSEEVVKTVATPVFTQNAFRLNLEGIVHIRLANIIGEKLQRMRRTKL